MTLREISNKHLCGGILYGVAGIALVAAGVNCIFQSGGRMAGFCIASEFDKGLSKK